MYPEPNYEVNETITPHTRQANTYVCSAAPSPGAQQFFLITADTLFRTEKCAEGAPTEDGSAKQEKFFGQKQLLELISS